MIREVPRTGKRIPIVPEEKTKEGAELATGEAVNTQPVVVTIDDDYDEDEEESESEEEDEDDEEGGGRLYSCRHQCGNICTLSTTYVGRMWKLRGKSGKLSLVFMLC